jgi:ATP-dependent DNA helicase RecG
LSKKIVSIGMMKKSELKATTLKGEDSRLQFKRDIRNEDALAAEMVAFSNSEGGRILIGVTDSGELAGFTREDVGRINQLISNAASQHVRKGNVALPGAGLRHQASIGGVAAN